MMTISTFLVCRVGHRDGPGADRLPSRLSDLGLSRRRRIVQAQRPVAAFINS
jgi:hypothetical protein